MSGLEEWNRRKRAERAEKALQADKLERGGGMAGSTGGRSEGPASDPRASCTDGNNAALLSNGNSRESKAESKGKRITPEFRAAMWKPGQSGNPGGRREMSPEVREALEAATLPAMQRLAQLVYSSDERVALLASQAVLDRAFGKAAQAVDKTVTVTTVQQQHLNILMELQARRDQAVKTIEGQAIEKKTDGKA